MKDPDEIIDKWIHWIQVLAGIVVGLVIIINEAFGEKNIEVMAFGAFIAGLGIPIAMDRSAKKRRQNGQKDDDKE